MPKILIVDDAADIRVLLQFYLKEHGYEDVQCCESAEQALELLAQQPFNIMFLDIEMPKVRGPELLEDLIHWYPDLHVIMCSAHKTLENVQHCWQIGAKGFLSKPFSAAQVQTTMARVSKLLG